MNDKRGYYFPVIAMSLLLLLVWLFSWLAVVAELFTGNESGLVSLVSAGGVRWAVRSAMQSINAIPWGTVMLLLVSLGLLRGSGLLRFAGHLFSSARLTRNERRASLFTLLALFFYCALLYVSAMSPWNLLLGITGSVGGSPFMQGAPLVVMLGVLLLSVVYGFVFGNYRSVTDVAGFAGDTVAMFVPALMAVVPAAGIVPSLDYTGIFDIAGVGESAIAMAGNIVVSLPFLHTVLLHLIEKKE